MTPGGGASQARWLGEEEIESPPQPTIGPGDRILAVDGQETRGLSQDAAARLVSLAGSEVRLTLARNLGLGCVAAAVPTHELRKRNGQAISRPNATVAPASSNSSLQVDKSVHTFLTVMRFNPRRSCSHVCIRRTGCLVKYLAFLRYCIFTYTRAESHKFGSPIARSWGRTTTVTSVY